MDELDDVIAAVARAVRTHANAPALTDHRGATFSYSDLLARVIATSHRLRAMGFRPGERMLFSVRPSPESVVLALGVVAAGGTVVFIDPGSGPELFASRTTLAEPSWAAAESLLYAASRPGPLRLVARRRGLILPNYAALPLRHVYSGRWIPGVPRQAVSTTTLARPTSEAPNPEPAPDQEAVIVFTSGTTSSPKAVVHTRRSLGAALRIVASRCALAPGDRVHTDQLMLGLPALISGARWTMPKYGFSDSADPIRLANGFRGSSGMGATHTFLVPADLTAVLDGLERGKVAIPGELRNILLGGAPVLPPLLRRARQLLPSVELLAIYGMTEILPIAMASAEEKLSYAGPGDLAGLPLSGVRARLSDEGELLVSGPNLCRGYLGDLPLSEHATGDLATVDRERIVLLGRSKDMIIRSHTNIYPALYEPAIAKIEGVSDAVMIGIGDEMGDERVILGVVPEETTVDGQEPKILNEPTLRNHVQKSLPHRIDASALPDEVVVLSHIPLSGRGRKPDRNQIRALVRREFDFPPMGTATS